MKQELLRNPPPIPYAKIAFRMAAAIPPPPQVQIMYERAMQLSESNKTSHGGNTQRCHNVYPMPRQREASALNDSHHVRHGSSNVGFTA